MHIQTKPEPYCPNCGARMVLRRPHKDGPKWSPFWGCSEFPACRGKRNIDSDGKPIMYEVNPNDNDRDMEPLAW